MPIADADVVPCLPESAPFTAEQRAYLNGFFAGLFSRAVAPTGAPSAGPPARTLVPLTILFGSQTGNAENLAKRIAKAVGQRGFAGTVHDLNKYPAAQLVTEQCLLVVTSTFGDGEPPDNARRFWEFLSGASAPKLSQARFSVCALGDSSYPQFCRFGKDLDARLESLGGQRAHPLAECDVDFEESFAKWLDGALRALGDSTAAPSSSVPSPANHSLRAHDSLAPRGTGAERGLQPVAASPQYTRSNPFLAPLLTNQKLNALGSEKDTRHFELALEGLGMAYEAGDALGVWPSNCPELVQDILGSLKCSGDELVPGRDATGLALREALLCHYEITKIPPPYLQAMAERSGDELLKKLTAPGVNGELTQFLSGREIIDLLLAHSGVKFAPEEFVGLLRKLQPRLYSISSSPKAHPGQVHLTVSVVRYESLGRRRKGVCSTFLAERVTPSASAPVFIHANKNFRPPSRGDTSIIMVGPGTGIAPFRAFLEERRAAGAKGKNWLFFGEQRAATDFLYRDQLNSMRQEHVLTRLDTAFSRDQPEKIYVQQRMRESGKELFAWLEDGAHFYVCGDATRMAKDVDLALREIIQTAGARTAEQAAEYVDRLKAERRYQRDVY